MVSFVMAATHLIHQPHPQPVDDGFDLDGGCDQDVVLGLDEEQQRCHENRRRPNADLSIPRGLCAGIDRSQNCGVAGTPEAGHDDQPVQGALHFAANELEEGHQCDVIRLRFRGGVNPDGCGELPPRPQQRSIALRAAIPFDAM
jgi:hypothetical protein